MRSAVVTTLFAVLFAAGCGAPPSSKPAGGDSAGQDQPAARRLPPLPPDPTQPAPDQPPAEVREKAVVGVGAKGQGYGGGIITEPISVYFRAPQMVAFKIQLPDAMNKYRGLNGHFPKSHEEFMEKIIKENMIELPVLRPGERYLYDPQKAAEMQTYDPADPPLFVVRPG